ncbi:MAG TPA: aryl-sulfate sulfotransferase [Ignavibacteria bacterium]|nr:hypothetical protein [Bacteroidota bacterium]HRI85038.1 aryl-sulfate sulfotransferase [Ignavibacteria bacterium]HRJ98742.1 aryl-sulfate sulfotransferase [Ignavibacteria bacterium]
MPKFKFNIILALLFFTLIFENNTAVSQPYPGYTLYTASSTRTNLLDLNNNIVKFWTHTRSGGYSVYLLRNGDLMRPAASTGSPINGGAAAGIVQKYSWSGSLIWEFTYSSNTYRTHHDICPMPNGNVLLIAWEVKTAAEAVAAGLNHSAVIWPDHIIEVQPSGSNGGTIVWKWHFWDHLIQDFDSTKANYGVVADHPELLNINEGSAGSGDWMHINGISYNERLDQIVISSHELDEIYVIDHSTTTEEAAGHTGGRYGKGGDILYRWGRPSNYGAPGPQIFNVVHSGSWVPDSVPGGGNLMAFNNREGTNASMVVEIIPPQDSLGFFYLAPGTAYGPATHTWSYSASGFYSNHLGGLQRLPNGNTMISESTSGNLFEVNSAGNIVWNFSPGGQIVRVLRYGFEYPGLVGISNTNSAIPENYSLEQNYPNPFNPVTTIRYSVPKSSIVSLKIYDVLGNEIRTIVNEEKQNSGSHSAVWDGRTDNGMNAASGVYFYKLTADNYANTMKMILTK